MQKLSVLCISFIFLAAKLITRIFASLIIVALIFVLGLKVNFDSKYSVIAFILSDILYLYLMQEKLTKWAKVPTSSIKLWNTLKRTDTIPFILVLINFLTFICLSSITVLVFKPSGHAFLPGVSKPWAFTLYGTLISAPIIEEYLFRGVILKYLQTEFNTLTSVILSSVIFGLLHYNGGLIKIIIGSLLGIYFSMLVLKYNSLGLCMIFHCLINIYYVFVSDIFQWHYLTPITAISTIIFIISSILLLIVYKRQKQNRFQSNSPDIVEIK